MWFQEGQSGHRLEAGIKLCDDKKGATKKMMIRKLQQTSKIDLCGPASYCHKQFTNADPVTPGKKNGDTGDGNTLHSTRRERTGGGVDILSSIPVAFPQRLHAVLDGLLLCMYSHCKGLMVHTFNLLVTGT